MCLHDLPAQFHLKPMSVDKIVSGFAPCGDLVWFPSPADSEASPLFLAASRRVGNQLSKLTDSSPSSAGFDEKKNRSVHLEADDR
jgi:hypothetical protein